MTSLVSLQRVTKGFGERPLFTDLTLHLAEDERLGLIGPNGAGKTTLLRLLGARDTPDAGERIVPRPLRTGWVEQAPDFPPEATLEDVLVARLAEPTRPGEAPFVGEDESTWPVRAGVTLGRLGFPDPQARVATLSGGWHRRLAIARALVNEPDLLLLDEPTNHLDLESILWLERFLAGLRTAYAVISHDRAFLQAVATRVLEVDPRYPGGTFAVVGRYHEFLERRESFLTAESSRRASLETKVAREVEWLSRGPKARTTKARGRIDEAERLQAELAEMKTRGRVERTQIDFAATERQTRRLLVAEGIGCQRGGRWLFRHLDLLLRPGVRLGLVGPNGSGKTTLLRVLAEEVPPDAGTLRTAPHVQTVYFDQQREQLDPEVSLRRALAPDGDTVLHQGRPIHVAGWARRFRFRADQLDTPLGRLSGGEQAKVLIARLMLRPADLLLLDEPTNDLDLPTLEVLEEALLEFPGAVVMVTHDRYLLDRVTNVILGLEGPPGVTGAPGSVVDPARTLAAGADPDAEGATHRYADVAQWLAGRRERAAQAASASAGAGGAAASARPRRARKALTYGEEIELAGLEERIAVAEAELADLEAGLTDPAVAADATRLAERFAAVEAARAAAERLVERWAELEEKKGEGP